MAREVLEMKNSSRTKSSLINGMVGSCGQLLSTFLNFVVRTVFIHYLRTEYLGVNGLFSNILYILNFAELGIGQAIVYNLYKPVAREDRERIKSLVDLYRRVYLAIGLVVLLLGLAVVPFLGYIIKEAPDIEESLAFIYILYLLETTGTYFAGYKRSVLLVYQKNYICSIIDLVLSVVKSVIQMVVLIVTKNYILYLVVYIVATILANVIISLYTDRLYPFLREKNVIKVKKEEAREIFSNVKSMFVYKIGNTVLNGTDNIILSTVVGIVAVGLYSNYSLVITAVSGILWTILTGLTGSIGNLNSTADKEKQEEIFLQVLFVSCVLYGFGCVCLGVLLKSFISLWIGEIYLLDLSVVVCLMVILYLRGISFANNAYRDTLGLFKEGRIAPLISSFINIVLSIVLGKRLGIMGVFLATVIAIVSTTFWFMPRIIYRNVFKKSLGIYLKKVIIFTVPFIVSYIICYNIVERIVVNSLLFLFLKGIVVVLVTGMITFLLVRKTKEYREVKIKVWSLVKKKGI